MSQQQSSHILGDEGVISYLGPENVGDADDSDQAVAVDHGDALDVMLGHQVRRLRFVG